MFILTQNSSNEVALLDCIQRFFSKHHVVFFASTFCIKLQKVFVGCCTYIL